MRDPKVCAGTRRLRKVIGRKGNTNDTPSARKRPESVTTDAHMRRIRETLWRRLDLVEDVWYLGNQVDDDELSSRPLEFCVRMHAGRLWILPYEVTETRDDGHCVVTRSVPRSADATAERAVPHALWAAKSVHTSEGVRGLGLFGTMPLDDDSDDDGAVDEGARVALWAQDGSVLSFPVVLTGETAALHAGSVRLPYVPRFEAF
jgi:hypothetical protein